MRICRQSLTQSKHGQTFTRVPLTQPEAWSGPYPIRANDLQPHRANNLQPNLSLVTQLYSLSITDSRAELDPGAGPDPTGANDLQPNLSLGT